MSQLKNINHTMHFLEAENRLSIGEQLRRTTNGSTLQDKWSLLLIKCMAKEGNDEKTTRKQLCRDSYENLFNVDFKTNLTVYGAPNAMLETTLDLVVWSSGPNGTNEFGKGDDIFLPQRIENR